MKAKILWLDLETSGLDPHRHAIIQLAAIVDAGDGVQLGELDLRIRPFKGSLVSRETLEKTGITMDDLRSDRYMDPSDAHEEFTAFMKRWVNPYDREDKFVIGGKQIKFDIEFLRRHFEKLEDAYYGSWFHYPSLDLEHLIAEYLVEGGPALPNYRLETLCKMFDIESSSFHDAMHDVKATMEIYYKLIGK